MKREIIFRGKSTGTTNWHKEEGAWVYGQFCSWYFDGGYNKDNPFTPTIFFIKDGIQHRTPVYLETVGQFTNLTDKNGTKIFEGDIVKWDDESNGKYWRVAVVELNPDIQFRIIERDDYALSTPAGYVFRFGNFAYRNTEKYLEIISSIHDQSEK